MANEAAFGCLIHRASGVSLLRSTSGGIGMSLGLGFLDFFGSASGFVFLLHLEILAQIYFATLRVSSTTQTHYAFWGVYSTVYMVQFATTPSGVSRSQLG